MGAAGPLPLPTGVELGNVGPMLSNAPAAVPPAAFAAQQVGTLTNTFANIAPGILPQVVSTGLGILGYAVAGAFLVGGALTIIGRPPDPIKKIIG